MNINVNSALSLEEFADIATGDLFLYPASCRSNCNIYMKTETVQRVSDSTEADDSHFCNAVCLSDGSTIGLFSSDEVTAIPDHNVKLKVIF